MTYKFTDSSEDKEIIRLYRTGQYSFQRIADMKNLSKSTVINIVKGYPYNKDKDARYYKLQNDSAEKLRDAITQEEAHARSAYERQDYSAYGNHMRRWLEMLDILSGKAPIYEELIEKRRLCEQQAWAAFSDGNYSLFGYYAETWGILSEAIGDNAKDPFAVTSIKINARSRSRSVKFSAVKIGETQCCDMSQVIPQTCFIGVSDELWSWLKDIIPTPDEKRSRGKGIDPRKILDGVLYAIVNNISFRSVPKRYGLKDTFYRYFQIWYQTEFLCTLLEMSDAWPELEIMRGQLWEIEKHRLVYPDTVPRLSDIRRSIQCEDTKDDSPKNT
jgi:predicted DNA-binding protein YlxM (UPF0122 family)